MEFFSIIVILSLSMAFLIYKLITHFHDVLRRDDLGNPIETKLRQISKDLHSVIKNYLQDTIESMVRSAQDKCPNVLNDEKVVDEIRCACLSKAQVSSQLVEEAVVEQAGSVILNKVNEVNLSIASTVSDRVIDEVVDSLSKACKSLQTGEGPRKRAMTGVETERDRGSSDSSKSERSCDVISQADSTSQKSDPSPLKLEYLNLATPQLASKRKSLHGRKLRPQSVVAESLDSVSELPSSCGQLQHLGKGRPRRVKTRAPTRPMGHADVLEEDHDISQGVETFFRPGSSTPTTPLVSPDSENSPRLTKYGSTSSMESFPHTGGARTGSERGSVESLTRSDSDVIRDSPRLKNKSEDEEMGEDKTEEENGEERRSVSSLIGKLGDAAMKLSPDLSGKRLSGFGSEDKSKEEEDTSHNRRSGGFQKFGVRAMGGNLLAEMKARQEKRSSFFAKDDDKKDDKEDKEELPNQSQGLLGGVKLRSTGLANNLKSPTNGGFSRSKSPNNRSSQEAEGGADLSPGSAVGRPQIMPLKPKPPPPLLGPKPRPKSAFTPDNRAASEDGDDEEEAVSHRSVRELVASLSNKGGIPQAPNSPPPTEEDKKKPSSLPRNSVPAAGGPNPLPSGSPALHIVMQPNEEDGIFPRGETSTDFSVLQRQTSQKLVLTSHEMTSEDVVDV